MCDNPKIIIRNTGANTMTSAKIGYWVCGGPIEQYTWNGSLEFMDTAVVELPFPGSEFYDHSQYCNLFHAEIFEVNGAEDDYAANNHMQSEFDAPPSIDGDIIVWYRTNNQPTQNELYIYDDMGNVVYSRVNEPANTQFKDTVALSPGCYKLQITDTGEDGLSFFASNQGTGSLLLRKPGAGVFKVFDGDFGSELIYYFTSGYTLNTVDYEDDIHVEVFPNPSNGRFNLNTRGLQGEVTIQCFDALGKLVHSENVFLENENIGLDLDMSHLTSGVYQMVVSDARNKKTIKVVLE